MSLHISSFCEWLVTDITKNLCVPLSNLPHPILPCTNSCPGVIGVTGVIWLVADPTVAVGIVLVIGLMTIGGTFETWCLM